MGLALALALHGLLLLGILWLAARQPSFETPPIPIDFLIEADALPGPIAPVPAVPLPAPTLPRAPSPRAVSKPRPPERAAPQLPRDVAPRPSGAEVPASPSSAPEGAPGAAGTAADPARVFGEGEVDAVAAPVGPITPRYPSREQMLGREDIVVLDVVVEADGRVRESRVVKSGGGGFDTAALDAVSRAAFRAARREGRSVPSRVTMRIHFELD